MGNTDAPDPLEDRLRVEGLPARGAAHTSTVRLTSTRLPGGRVSSRRPPVRPRIATGGLLHPSPPPVSGIADPVHSSDLGPRSAERAGSPRRRGRQRDDVLRLSAAMTAKMRRLGPPTAAGARHHRGRGKETPEQLAALRCFVERSGGYRDRLRTSARRSDELRLIAAPTHLRAPSWASRPGARFGQGHGRPTVAPGCTGCVPPLQAALRGRLAWPSAASSSSAGQGPVVRWARRPRRRARNRAVTELRRNRAPWRARSAPRMVPLAARTHSSAT